MFSRTLLTTQFFKFFNVLWRRRTGRIVLFLLAVPYLGYLILRVILLSYPFPVNDLNTEYPDSWRILDRHGNLLREVVNPDGFRARWIELEAISPLVVEAIIAAEDKRFYQHSGVDFLAIGRAIYQNIVAKRVVSGASTVSMQLSRILYGYSHDWPGKLRQAVTALRLEQTVDKRTILEHYLNRAFYGAGTIGIEAASQRYFRKSCRHLSLAEAALLAGLPRAPTTLNPLREPGAARERHRYVLERMLKTGKISTQEFERACRESIQMQAYPTLPLAMHFTEYVLSQSPPPGEVMTTLDIDLQRQIEELVKDHVESLRTGGLTNAAVIVLDNRDGGILAMVGSTDYWNPNGGSVNGVIARRQPGSTLKPFTYALAFEQGFTPASIVPDIETQYLGAKGRLFVPTNYSDLFYGPVLMKEALGRSLNVPAVRTLNRVGVKNLLERLHAVGFSSLDQDVWHYGLSLTLGGGEVSLLELAQGYAMFARGGLTCKAKTILDPPGFSNAVDLRESSSPPLVGGVRGGGTRQPEKPYSPPPNLSFRQAQDRLHQGGGILTEAPQRVFSEEICFLITDILSDESLRVLAFGTNNPLLLGFPMAIKTGTSPNWRDNWVVGYTKDYTIAVWAGNFEGYPMNQMVSAVGAGPLFHKIARLVVGRGMLSPIATLPEPPEGVELIEVCSLSGLMPTKHCPHRRLLYVLKEDKPRSVCNIHRKFRVDKRNGLLASERCPSAFVEERVFTVLPSLYAEWQAKYGDQHPPTQYSPYCPEKGLTASALIITNPRNDEVYLIEPGYNRNTQTLQLSGEVDPALPEVTWLMDGQKIVTVAWPYDTNWPMTRGKHRIEMVGSGMHSDPIEFEVR